MKKSANQFKMPQVYGEKKSKTKQNKSKEVFDIDGDSDNKGENMLDAVRGNKRGKKRSFETPSAVDFYDSMEEEEQDEETKNNGDVEMQNLLASFGVLAHGNQPDTDDVVCALLPEEAAPAGLPPAFPFNTRHARKSKADIRKNIATKRKNVQQFTVGALKTTDKKVGEIWKRQKIDRSKLVEEYSKSVKTVINQWDNDVQKMTDAEEKYETLFQQMHKTMQQQRVVQNQRIKTLIQLTDQLNKSFEELENCHFQQQGNVQGELRKEMAGLQKRIMKETQQQELSNVRKSLQTMLGQV